jgi:hypothetical protein
MTQVLIDREVRERAVALLMQGDTDNGQERLAVAQALRAALEAKPQHEFITGGYKQLGDFRPPKVEVVKPQEPVAWYRPESGIRVYYESNCYDDLQPLYAAPVADQSARNHQVTNDELIDSQQSMQERIAQECHDADHLLRLLRLDPLVYRTEGGSINLPKVRAALKHPDEYPMLPTAEEGESIPESPATVCSTDSGTAWAYQKAKAELVRDVRDTHIELLQERIAELEAQLAAEKERADYAWKNTNTIEKARQECEEKLTAEREARQKAEKDAERMIEVAGNFLRCDALGKCVALRGTNEYVDLFNAVNNNCVPYAAIAQGKGPT